MDEDLKRISSAVQAVRMRYPIKMRFSVEDTRGSETVFSGSYVQCQQWVSDRCQTAALASVQSGEPCQ